MRNARHRKQVDKNQPPPEETLPGVDHERAEREFSDWSCLETYYRHLDNEERRYLEWWEKENGISTWGSCSDRW